MSIESKILNSKDLRKKMEFLTIQSSEQNSEEVRYKNINRKQIKFDLNDFPTMQELELLLNPYGLVHYLENVFVKSNISFLRIIAEKRLATRGAKFLRALYLKHPEKFSSVDLSSNKSTRMMIIRGTLVVTEQVNQKTILLVNDEEGYVSELKFFRDKFKKEEEMLKMQEATI